jgi:hypothetical protein
MLPGTLDATGPTCEYTIDGGPPTISQMSSTVAGSQHHTQFYSMTNLVDGAHTLNITIAQMNVSLSWYLDYIIYTPSADASTSSLGETFFFDDTDDAFQYSGSWSTGDGTEEDMQDTLHGALSLNSSVSLQFTGEYGTKAVYLSDKDKLLIGTYVNVYGRLPYSTNITNVAQIVIDGGSPFIATYPSYTNIVFDATTDASSGYRLYHNPSLPSGSHVMVITPAAEQALWLDYVTAGTGVDLSNPQDSAGGSSSPSSTPSAARSPSPPSSTPSAPGSPNRRLPSSLVPVIVAGVTAGSIVLLALLAVGIFFCIRRKRKRRGITKNPDLLGNTDINATTNEIPEHRRNLLVTPYDNSHSDLMTSGEESESTGNTGRWRIREKPRVQIGTSTPSAATIVSPASAYPSSTALSYSGMPVTPTSIRHTDSGIRGVIPTDSGLLLEELPPLYSLD